jgi:hypothetical protein
MRSSSELQSGAAIEHTGRSKDSNASPKAADAPRKRSKLQFVVLHRNCASKLASQNASDSAQKPTNVTFGEQEGGDSRASAPT